MFPQPMSWSEPQENKPNSIAGLPHSDLALALRQHVLEGLSPELALDLTLHEVVVRAADATAASAAALALVRDGEMVCRASTGQHAPDLGTRLNTRDGLSGACLGTREPQLCLDTETDPRVDAATSRRLGIRSMLIVPILDRDSLIGVIEVFSADPNTFSPAHDILLESFARTCARLRQLAVELAQSSPQPEAELLSPLALAAHLPAHKPRTSSELWTLILGCLVAASAVALSFMIGSRIGWSGSSASNAPAKVPGAIPAESTRATAPQPAPKNNFGKPNSKAAVNPAPASNGLVVYDQGKVVFRLKPAPHAAQGSSESGSATPANHAVVWLAPEVAERRLKQRVEPQYPAEARAAHRSGDVVLEVIVGTDGHVASVRTLTGDPLLAEAASSAIRQWHYEPPRVQGLPAGFQTEVTLKFALPD
jgi:TonB family protein